MPHSLVTVALILLALSGCSSVPEKIRKAPADAPSLTLVRQTPAAYEGAQVRWGGTIARVTNLQGETRIEIVARALAGDGEPRDLDRSEGRFIAVFDTFLDPAIYAVDRSLTVLGTLSGSTEGKLGAMDYRYPLVRVEAHYLWPKPVPRCETCDPLFYDPWYPWYPYYPWRRYPYYYY
jgi:outer membrane lipoprotein